MNTRPELTALFIAVAAGFAAGCVAPTSTTSSEGGDAPDALNAAAPTAGGDGATIVALKLHDGRVSIAISVGGPLVTITDLEGNVTAADLTLDELRAAGARDLSPHHLVARVRGRVHRSEPRRPEPAPGARRLGSGRPRRAPRDALNDPEWSGAHDAKGESMRTKPSSSARVTAAVLPWTPSLSNAWTRWVLTVASLTKSALAIVAFEAPRAR